MKEELRSDRSAAGQVAPTRVVVAEDSYVIREFLTMVLGAAPEVELVAVCSNGTELQKAIDIWNPEVVVTDIRMPPTHGMEGITVALSLHESRPEIGVVVISQYADPEYAVALLRHGSARRGYVLKDRLGDRTECGVLVARPTSAEFWVAASNPDERALRERYVREAGGDVLAGLERLAHDHPRGCDAIQGGSTV